MKPVTSTWFCGCPASEKAQPWLRTARAWRWRRRAEERSSRDSSLRSGTPSHSGHGTFAPTHAPSAATSSTSPPSRRKQTRAWRTTLATRSRGDAAATSSISTAFRVGSRRAPSARSATESGNSQRSKRSRPTAISNDASSVVSCTDTQRERNLLQPPRARMPTSTHTRTQTETRVWARALTDTGTHPAAAASAPLRPFSRALSSPFPALFSRALRRLSLSRRRLSVCVDADGQMRPARGAALRLGTRARCWRT